MTHLAENRQRTVISHHPSDRHLVLLCYIVPGFTLRFEIKCNLLGYTPCRVLFAR
jgi:hypothetical protein